MCHGDVPWGKLCEGICEGSYLDSRGAQNIEHAPSRPTHFEKHSHCHFPFRFFSFSSFLFPGLMSSIRYYRCSDALLKTTSAYLADADEIESLVSAGLVIIAVSSVVFAAQFRVAFSKRYTGQRRWGQQPPPSPQQQPPPQTPQDGREAQPQVPVEGEKQQHSGIDDIPDAGDKTDDECAGASFSGGAGANSHHPVLLLLLWVSSLVLLSIPSFIYGLTTVIPTEDSIFPHFATIADIVHAAGPIIITFINSVIIPTVVVYCCDRAAWQSARLLLASRLLTTWLVPVAVIVVFSDSCGRNWLRYVRVCGVRVNMMCTRKAMQ